MDQNRIASLIETNAGESLGLEYKAAFDWKTKHDDISWIQARVIRAILGFTNTPGGGLILIGITDDGKSSRDFTGLDASALASYNDLEALQDCIDRYADIPLSYSIQQVVYKGIAGEQTFIAISVNEFSSRPALCTRNLVIQKTNGKGEYALREHDMYARAKKGRFSTIKVTGIELESIINMAHGKAEDRIRQLFGDLTGGSLGHQSQNSPYLEMDKDL